MNLKQTAKLIQLLKASGVTRYKTVDVELEFSNSPSSTSGTRVPIPSKKRSASAQQPSPAGADLVPKDLPIPHHMSEVRSLLKLDNESLVDRMFPEGPLPLHLRAE